MIYISLIFSVGLMLFMPTNHAMDKPGIQIPLGGLALSQADQRGQQLLSAVHTDKNIAAIDRFINNGANLNITGENRETSLIKAIKNGAVIVAKKLIDAGADVNIADDDGLTPLVWAVRHGHQEIVQELIKAKAKINHVDKFNNTALFYSVVYGQNEIAKFLMDWGANVNIPSHIDKNGVVTPIMYAVFQNNIELVPYLIEAGADFYVLDQNDKTLFSLAADKPEMLEIIKKFFSNLLVPFEENRRKGQELLSWLNLADQENENISEIKRLISQGAYLDVIGKNGETPLIKAIKNGTIDVAKEMIDAGANVNIADNNKITPLIWAVHLGYGEIVQKLIMTGAEIDHVDKFNNTALFHSVAYGQNDIAKFLMSRGADADIPSHMDKNGFVTPIMYAVFQNNKELVRDLIEVGADFYVLGQNKTLFSLAADKPEMLEILKQDACSVLVTPQDDIIERIMQDIDKIGDQGYIGLESPLLSNMKLITKLREAASRGVTIHVYLDSLHYQHSKLLHVYNDHLKSLGVKVFEIPNLHTKRILIAEKKPEKNEIDGSTVFYVGSMNFSENAPDNIEVMLRCVDREGFLQNYTNQMVLDSGEYGQQIFSDEKSEKRVLSSTQPEAHKKKIDLIKELPRCNHPDDMIYIASMSFNDKCFLNQLLSARKEFSKPIKIILDAKSWNTQYTRNNVLKPLVQAGAEVYIYNKKGDKKTSKDFEVLFHIKALLRICNQKCIAVISTGNLTERNKKTINYDYWQSCSQKFSNNLKNVLDRVIEQSEKLELSSFN